MENNMQELIENVIKWAEDKNLLHPENSPMQYLKIIEECGETCRAILKDDKDGQKDGLGDIMVTLIIYAEQMGVEQNFAVTGAQDEKNISIEGFVLWFMNTFHGSDDSVDYCFSVLSGLCKKLGFTPEECLQAAWDEIRDRKGKTVNGSFIKDEPKEEDWTLQTR